MGLGLGLHGACQAVSSVCTGHAIWHGSRSFLHGSSLFLHGACDFPSSEVGSPNFSQYSELVMIWKLIDFDKEA